MRSKLHDFFPTKLFILGNTHTLSFFFYLFLIIYLIHDSNFFAPFCLALFFSNLCYKRFRSILFETMILATFFLCKYPMDEKRRHE